MGSRPVVAEWVGVSAFEGHGRALRLGQFMGAGLVGGRVGGAVSGLDHAILEHPSLHLVAADVGKDPAVDLDAGLTGLACLLDHLLEAFRAVDDVAFLEGEVVLLEHRADARAPSAPWLEPCHNPGFFHSHLRAAACRRMGEVQRWILGKVVWHPLVRLGNVLGLRRLMDGGFRLEGHGSPRNGGGDSLWG